MGLESDSVEQYKARLILPVGRRPENCEKERYFDS